MTEFFQKWDEVLHAANVLRCQSLADQSEGLAELADAKMRELRTMVEQYDHDHQELGQ